MPSMKRLLAMSLLLPVLAACNETEETAAPQGEAPPAAVSIVTVAEETLPIINELPGRIAPTRIAEVRPRVSGIVVERVFEQGSLVDQDEVLYRIDPGPFQVQVDRARAALQRAEAVQLQASQQAERQSELRERNVASAQQQEAAVAALAQANADVAAAQAGLAAAELDLHYTQVRAPIEGRIGRAMITEGALVSSSGESLATIQQLDPVYADFTQSAGALMELRRALDLGSLASAAPGEAPARLRFDDGREYKHPGRVLFAEAAVDATTGQVTLRAEFPNPEGDLLPGLYVRVLVEQGVQQNAIAVSQQAIQRDIGGRAQVYLVGEDETLELRPVRPGRTVGHRVVIDEGLADGDRVVVEGFQKIQPGAKVKAEAWVQDDESDPASSDISAKAG